MSLSIPNNHDLIKWKREVLRGFMGNLASTFGSDRGVAVLSRTVATDSEIL